MQEPGGEMTFRGGVEKYLAAVAAQAKRGDAREESYYDALKALFVELGPQVSNAHTSLTVLPRETEAGNPDMRVWSDDQHVTGYVECKEPGETNLDRVEASEQLQRYLGAFPNVILTNFLEFRLYRSGEALGSPVVIANGQLLGMGGRLPFQHEEEFRTLLKQFFDFALPQTYTAQTLAVALAVRTRYLKDQVVGQLTEDEEQGHGGELVGLKDEFRQVLISDLTTDTFADLYAQTITYGMFAARMRASGAFSRAAALAGIPAPIGILRKLFRYISAGDTPERLSVIVDDIASVLAAADTSVIFGEADRDGRDPVADFYETFLGKYDPAKKKQHGVYYTPKPVVEYIVRSIDGIVRNTFGKADGLASSGVTVLDPAAGTMTFTAVATELAAKTFTDKYGNGSIAGWIDDHVLKDFYAFELMMAPYAMGHLRMDALLGELGYQMKLEDRFKLYLTNTLDVTTAAQGTLPGLSPLAEESHMAEMVKVDEPVLVIMGNPPYSGVSSNKGPWIKKLIEDYKKVDGKPLGEKNPKWLQDDYVKFIRFAQWKIDQVGEGVLGFITNHSYLDNPTFRGMRQSLMASFDQIHILNLHGNAKKKEQAPDGTKDENVFDIQQGVAIILAIKKQGLARGVWQADLWGTREAKYNTLARTDLQTTEWHKLTPQQDQYLFVPQDVTGREEYLSWPKVTDIFPVSSVGIVTARDRLTIQFTENDVWQTVNRFISLSPDQAREAFHLGPDARDWKVTLAQQDIRDSGPDRKNIVPILYRPFDVRYTYYTGHSRGFICMPRADVMRNMMYSRALGLATCRQIVGGRWEHAFVTSHMTDDSLVSNRTKERGYLAPLYVAREERTDDLLAGSDVSMSSIVPNVRRDLLTSLEGLYGRSATPERTLAYVYALLYSPEYRKRYLTFLTTGFPRIPLPHDAGTFISLSDPGQQLIDLHLMRSPELDNPISRFCGKGDSAVAKVTYDADLKRVYINETQYFENVVPDVWAYQIGGYQVLDKWLKDRKGRFLSAADSWHYSRIVTALAKTIAIQTEIDTAILASDLFGSA